MRKSLRDRQHQLREEIILEAAHHCIMEQGYAALNMDELANQVGVSKATLYQHFSSKDELAVQVILRSMQEGAEFFRQIDSQLPPLTRLEKLLRFGIERRIRVATTRASTHPPHIREDPRIKAQHQKLAAVLSGMIEEAKAEGTVREELATPVIVGMYFSFFSPHFMELLGEHIVTPEELIETLVSLFLNGIRKPSPII